MKTLLVFLFLNTSGLLLVELIPAEGVEDNRFLNWGVNLAFMGTVVCVSLLFFVIACGQLRVSKVAQFLGKRDESQIKGISKVAKYSAFASLLGIAALAFERIAIRGINYGAGLRSARYEWLDSGSGSIFGISGNLLIPFSYFCIFTVIAHSHSFLLRCLLICAATTGVLGHAALNGGRSNILFAAGIVAIAFVVKPDRGITKRTVSNIFLLGGAAVIVVGSFLYVSAIIKSSADLGNVELSDLLFLGVDALYGRLDPNFDVDLQSPIVILLIYIVAYLFHGQWTAQVAYSYSEREGSYSITSFPTAMLEKWGVIDLNSSEKMFSETGAFISLPGAFYYDLGFFGVFLGGGILGLALGVCFVLMRAGNVGPKGTAFIVAAYLVAFLCPILPAYGLAYYFFIVAAFAVLGFGSRRKVSLISCR